jgi:regulator of sigma E protease
MFLLTLIVFFIILGIVVLIHEWGHFIVARKNGILVEEFGFGMPPRLIGIQRLGNRWKLIPGTKPPEDITATVYSINSLPLGGFVKLYGDGAGGEGGTVEPKLAHLALDNKSVWARAAVMISGIVMNLVLGVGIYFALLATNNFTSDPLPSIGDPTFAFGTKKDYVAVLSVRDNSPAQKAGLKPEDIVLRFNESAQASGPWVTVRKPEDLINAVKQNGAKTILLEIRNAKDGLVRVVPVTPVYDKPEKRALIGVGLMNYFSLSYQKPEEKLFSGILHSYNLLRYNTHILSQLVGHSVERKDATIIGEAVSGPVAIGRVVNEMLRTSGEMLIRNLLNLTALISLSLAVMNILPIPALDGGRLALLIPEMVTGRRINQRVERIVNTAGFFFLIGLSILITIKDVTNLFQ